MLACLTLDSVQQEKVEDVLQHLREKSVRITETRRAVLSYLVKSQEHPSADAIYQDLKPAFPYMSLATVYNNLKVLIEEGFVSEIKVRNDTTTYFDFMGHDHLNLICESCGKIDDIDIEVPDENIINRMSGRRSCKDCGAIFHVQYNPPKKENCCDVCGGELILRDDDKAETVKKRLDVYHEQTAPLIAHYKEAGSLHEIDGTQDIKVVFEEIKSILG